MIAYKLVQKNKNGDLKPLFMGKKVVSYNPTGKWLKAENHNRKGFALREGFHCCLSVDGAPHLSTKGRVWIRVEVQDYELHERPQSQGGTWVLAKYMKVLEVL